MKKTFLIGIVLLIYGIFKVTVALVTISLSKKNKPYIESHPILRRLIKLDTTIAGKAIQVSILAFSAFTLMRGLYHLRAIRSPKLRSILDRHSTTYILYGIMGVFLTTFYAAIVLSTDARSLIESDPKEIPTYRLVGIGSGLLFLLIMAALYLYHHRLTHITNPYAIPTILVFMSVVLTMIAAVLVKSASRLAAAKQEIVTMLMIPLAGA